MKMTEWKEIQFRIISGTEKRGEKFFEKQIEAQGLHANTVGRVSIV